MNTNLNSVKGKNNINDVGETTDISEDNHKNYGTIEKQGEIHNCLSKYLREIYDLIEK